MHEVASLGQSKWLKRAVSCRLCAARSSCHTHTLVVLAPNIGTILGLASATGREGILWRAFENWLRSRRPAAEPVPQLPPRLQIGNQARNFARNGKYSAIVQLARSSDIAVFETDGMRPIPLHDLEPLERQVVVETACISCQSPASLAQLCRCVRYVVSHDILGDFVECGVFQGASAIAIIRTLQSLNVTDRRLWLYDTYEGMPEPEAIDRFYCDSPDQAGKNWDSLKRNDGSGGSNWVYSPLDEVRQNVLQTGYPEHLVNFVKGKVEDTIPNTVPDAICLLRLDTDFYASTKHEFEHLFPLVSLKAPIIIDDYGAYDGSRLATDEYLNKLGAPVLLSRIDEHVRMFVK
jgi:O-methyltransferase